MTTHRLADDAPLDPDDERLVAYLDGELERPQRDELETRLMDEEGLRKRLQQLQRGWDLLGELDVPAPSHKLVESTLELAVIDLVQPTSNRAGGFLGRNGWPLGIALACLVAVGSVLAAAWIFKSSQYRRQLNDLAIVEHLDAYQHGSNIALMRQLADDQQWRQMIQASREITPQGATSIQPITSLSSKSIEDREQLIAKLPLERRVELNSRWERFKRLDPVNQDRIRATAKTVAAQEDAQELLQTMNAYAVWRESIQPLELRDQIESDDPQARRAAIATAVQNSQRQIAERSSYMLDEETVEQIYFVLRQIVLQRIEHGDEETKRGFQRLSELPGVKDPAAAALALTVLRGDSLGPRRPEPLSESELAWIRLVLSDEALETLEGISGGFPLTETMTLRIWAEEAVRRRYRRPQTETTLERYQSLDPNERELLDLLPAKKILEKLSE